MRIKEERESAMTPCKVVHIHDKNIQTDHNVKETYSTSSTPLKNSCSVLLPVISVTQILKVVSTNLTI